MLFNYVTSQLLLVLFTIFVVVLAGPCMPCQPSNRRDTPWDHGLLSRGVYSPKITNPTKGSIWNVASDNVVTWDLQDKSDKTSKSKGTLLLGYFEGGSDEEHLYFEHSLASNFDMESGSITVKCPKVEPRDNYIVVLIGDSGNRSPPFSIKN